MTEASGKFDTATVVRAMAHSDATLSIMGVALVTIVVLTVFKPF